MWFALAGACACMAVLIWVAPAAGGEGKDDGKEDEADGDDDGDEG